LTLKGTRSARREFDRRTGHEPDYLEVSRMVKFRLRAGRNAVALALAAVLTFGAGAASATSTPQPVIDALDHSLLGVMKDADKLGYQGRYDTLRPIIEKTFNVRLMTQLIVGTAWSGWTEEQRDEVTEAFFKFITATYARRFDGYSGEDFVIDGDRPGTNGTVVLTRLTRPKDPPVTINYLVRPNDSGVPQVVDVYLTGTISELATRRSEFGAVLQHDGFKGLLAALDKKASGLASN
jgi:phospholipid transport system substrate-binding protein